MRVLVILLTIIIYNPFFVSSILAAPTTLDTASYDAFSTTEKIDSDTIIHVFRQGTSHASDYGKLVAEKYTISTGTWGTRYTVFEDATTDVRDPASLMINGRLWIFFTKYNLSTQTSSGYIVAQNAEATSWSSYTEMYAKEAAIDGFNFHNDAVAIRDLDGAYIIPWAKHDDTGPVWELVFWRTTDSGATWAEIDVYSGSTKWVEPSIAYLGGGLLIATARDNDGNYLGYTKSSDYGVTWSAMATNSKWGNASSVKPSVVWYDEEQDNIVVAYLDRGFGASDIFKVSHCQNPWACFVSPSRFDSTVSLDSNGYNNSANGYPAIERVSPTQYLVIWSKSPTLADSDILYELRDLGVGTSPRIRVE